MTMAQAISPRAHLIRKLSLDAMKTRKLQCKKKEIALQLDNT